MRTTINPFYYVGIDISKNKLDAYFRASNQFTTFQNTEHGIRKLIEKIRRATATGPRPLVVCEATGAYQELLIEKLTEASILSRVLNPTWVRNFARSEGRMAKSDKIDAEIITRMAEQKQLEASAPLSAQEKELQSLARRRHELIDMVTQEKNRYQQTRNAVVKSQIHDLIVYLESLVEEVETRQAELIEQDKELKSKFDRLIEVKGIGKITAITVLTEMPELGKLEKGQPAALAGVAPHCADSGQSKGKRQIRGGRSQVRRSLYMAALSASQSNVILSKTYQEMLARGKPKKVALTALMRKLIELMNRLLANPKMVLQ